MKLFGKYEAVMFPEENMIFITHREYLYYIYDLKYNRWRKHKNAGNDKITVCNYQDVNEKEIKDAMSGIFPTKETDFMRLCKPSELSIRNMLRLLEEDYPDYMNEINAEYTVHVFLEKSNIPHKSYLRLKELFDNAKSLKQDNEQTVDQINKLSFEIIGRDIFKEEIRIVDGHDCSSYFWIMPVRVIDYSDIEKRDAVAAMRRLEISIEEDDVYKYLTPFLYKHFDVDLKANKMRIDKYGFEWYLTHNFYTNDSMMNIIRDINDTIEALVSGNENEYTAKLKKSRGIEEDTEVELIIDFYRRFIYRIEYMMKVGKENGYDLISFMGP